ncbi:ketoacyl-ACP synthase III [Actinosynnema sp. NPDC051121]
MPTAILSIGSHVPDRVIGNGPVARWAGVTETWIAERTGILERRYAADDVTTSDLARHAAEQVFAQHPAARERVGAIIVATCTPDVPQPATAAILQGKLGLRSVPAFDVNAVCSGFLYSLAIADGLLSRAREDEQVLVVGADKFSSIMNRADRRTVSLFGDGAGAVLLGRVPEGYGLLGLRMVSDGELNHYVGVEAGGTRTPLDQRARDAGEHLLRMDGRPIRGYAASTLRKLVEQVLDDTGTGLEEVDRFVFHQANVRLLEDFADSLGVDRARFAFTAPRYGNTAGASIPITLRASADERPITRGERVLMASVGGGMNAAAALFRWY